MFKAFPESIAPMVVGGRPENIRSARLAGAGAIPAPITDEANGNLNAEEMWLS